MTSPHNASHRLELMSVYHSLTDGLRHYLPALFDAATIETVVKEAHDIFHTMLPDIPDIGDESVDLKNTFSTVAACIAYYKALKKRGVSVETLGKILYSMRTDQMNAMTEELKKGASEEMFSAQRLEELKAWAEWSQKRTCPDNWVGKYIKGDGKKFDYGMDYTECSVVKICRQFNVEELTLFICLLDFPTSAALDLGLVRTKNLALGYPLCDFRYKKGRPTTQDWDSEIEEIREYTASIPRQAPPQE